jgi:hypothetical protein
MRTIIPVRKMAYKQENARLKQEIELLQEEVAALKDQLRKPDIPDYARQWMYEYDLYWEVFWCFEHNEWVTELDSLFPYYWSDNFCPKCLSNDGDTDTLN